MILGGRIYYVYPGRSVDLENNLVDRDRWLFLKTVVSKKLILSNKYLQSNLMLSCTVLISLKKANKLSLDPIQIMNIYRLQTRNKPKCRLKCLDRCVLFQIHP